MGKQLETFIDFKHKPAECPRQRAVARILQATDEDFSVETDENPADFDGKAEHEEYVTNVFKLQSELGQEDIEIPAHSKSRKSSHDVVTPSNMVLTINIIQTSGENLKSVGFIQISCFGSSSGEILNYR